MDEETELVSASLMNRVYYAARDGMAITLYAMLSGKEPELCSRLISQKVLQEDGQCCTPFIVAARFGHTKVVKMLLDKFKFDINQEGSVKLEGFIIKGVSALWCATAAGHLNVVKTLVKAGANVNHPTKTNSTPVRAACYDGRLDIVKYLIDHSANIHIANKDNNTCLMIAAYKGHLDIVSFLLESGADPNVKSHCKETALHYAAECGHCSIVKKLLKYGSKMLKNAHNMTPLLSAAERSRAEVVECLIKHEAVSKEDSIDAYELLGASFANDKDHYCVLKAYSYLHKAMCLRYSDPNNIIKKNIGEPIPAYDNWRECETLERLESIRTNHHGIHMEALAIRERILGRQNPDVSLHVVYRGAIFADNARFDRCIDLWLHALFIRRFNNMSISKDLLKFAQIFSQMIHLGIQLKLSQVLNVLEACVLELERNKKCLTEPDPKDGSDQSVFEEIESNMLNTLYIITILTKLKTLYEKDYSEADLDRIIYLLHRLCALQMTLKDGQTALHLAVNADTPVDDFHTNDVCKFPCAATAKLLIHCGANVNAMDNERNTPLHIIVQYEKPISHFMTLHSIILDLIEAGAHMDIVNSQGKTPFDAATTGVAEMILRTQTKLSLKCMAAKAVKTYNLSYNGNVPRSLESFIELHGPGLNQG